MERTYAAAAVLAGLLALPVTPDDAGTTAGLTSTAQSNLGGIRPSSTAIARGTRGLGKLKVRVHGLDHGFSGKVRVTGPEGYSVSLGHTRTLRRLRPGQYRIKAMKPRSASYVSTVEVSRRKVEVRSRRTSKVVVTFSVRPRRPRNLIVTGRTPTSISLSWRFATAPGLRVQVRRRSGFRPPTRLEGGVAIPLRSIAAMSATNIGLTASKTYSYAVFVSDGAGRISLPATVTTSTRAPPSPGQIAPVRADALPTVQLNGVVWSQAVVGNRVFVAGRFSSARPAGAAPGVREVRRYNLLAYDITTGKLDSTFAPILNGQALAVVASPDNSRVYVGGSFSRVNGKTRSRIAAFDANTGALVESFHPTAETSVRAIAVSDATVFFGGDFTSVDGVPRQYLASARVTDGHLLPWNPTPSAAVTAMTLTADHSRLVVGGRFRQMGRTAAFGLAALDPATGVILPWAATNVVRNAGTKSSLLTLTAYGSDVYGGGFVSDRTHGNLEGVFRADGTTGRIKWLEDCHGDTYSTFPTGHMVYVASHAHYCGNVDNGFQQTDPWTHHRATAFTKSATSTLKPDPHGYANFAGQPSPRLINWFPDLAAGIITGQHQAAWSITGTNKYISVGGEFPSVNGMKQQGLVRFAVRQLAPNRSAPSSNRGLTPAVTSFRAGEVHVGWQATYDRDDTALTYRVYRDFKSLADRPVCELTAMSRFDRRPTLGCWDTTAAPGATVKYRVYAFDSDGNSASRAAASVVVATTDSPDRYAPAVLDDSPSHYWRLNDRRLDILVDAVGADPMRGSGPLTPNAPGAVAWNKAITFTGGSAANQYSQNTPTALTLEVWIHTTAGSSGKILGYGSAINTNSKWADRHLYLDNAGRVVFGVRDAQGVIRTIRTPGTVNNGTWHHIAATLGPTGLALYLDGSLAASRANTTTARPYTGYWHIGGDTLAGWPGTPTTSSFIGTIDEAATYPTVLTATQIARHYTASGR